jgi:hypothetical protein
MKTTTAIIPVHAFTCVNVWTAELIVEWVTLHIGKGDLKAYDLCLLILFGCSVVWQAVSFFLPGEADAFEGRRFSFAQIYTMDK